MLEKSVLLPLVAIVAGLLVSACVTVTSPSGAGDPTPSSQSPDH